MAASVKRGRMEQTLCVFMHDAITAAPISFQSSTLLNYSHYRVTLPITITRTERFLPNLRKTTPQHVQYGEKRAIPKEIPKKNYRKQ